MSRKSAAGVALLVTAAAALLLAPVIHWTRQVESEQRCRVHLQQIGSALLVYRAERKRWPDARGGAVLRSLVDTGILEDATALTCPTGGHYQGWDAPPPPGRFSWNGRSQRMAAGDAVANHGDRRLILFLDGSVRTWPLAKGQPTTPPDAQGTLVD